MAGLVSLGQPFGGPSRIINVPAPAPSPFGQAIERGAGQIGQALGIRKQRQLEQADRALLGQVLGADDVTADSLSRAMSSFQSDKYRGISDQLIAQQLSQRMDPLGGRGRLADVEKTEAETAKLVAETERLPEPTALTFDEERKRQLIAAGLKPKAISDLEQRHIKSQIQKTRAESEKLLRASRGNLTPEQKIAQGNTFRKEFDALSSDFRKIRDSFQRIEVAAADPSAAGDLAIIFNFMKILDPGSVVRESEFATAENAAGVPDKIRNMWNKALTGERITFNRSDFVNQARNLFKAQQNTQNKLIKRYTSLSERFGVNPQDVITETDITVEDKIQPFVGPTFTPEEIEAELKRRGIQ